MRDVFLYKPHTLENSGSQAIGQNAHVQSDRRIHWSSLSPEVMNQFLWFFLHGEFHQGKVAFKITDFGWEFPGMSSHAQTCPALSGLPLGSHGDIPGKK